MPMHIKEGGTSTRNTLGVFDYMPSTFVGTKDKPAPYVELDRRKPERWKGKQCEGGNATKRGSVSRLSTVPGTVGTEALFEPAFQRMFEGDGYSGDIKNPTERLNGRAAFTNTINTERYRETLRKEDRITGGNAEELAQVSLSNLQQRRAEDAEDQGGTDKRRIMDAMVRDRRYKPTSSALTIGTKLHMTAECNPQNYLPPVDGFPAAYRNPHAHRRSALTEKCWFKMGGKAGPPAE